MTNIKYADNPSSNLDSEEYWEWVAMVWGEVGFCDILKFVVFLYR